MDIFSKRTGPREEDKQAKAHISRNWGTIEKLADQISGGSYSANKTRASVLNPQAGQPSSGRIIIDQAVRARADTPEPYLRISQNGRVVLVDKNSGRQLHFLGQLKRHNGTVRFVIATAENGFISPVDPELFALIGDLADAPLGRDYTEVDLGRDLKTRLSLA